MLPTPKTQQETADDKTKSDDQSSANWWMVILTGAIASIGMIQAVVFWIQAKRLKQTINKMEEIASQHTSDIQASIAEATRGAKAMEQIAESMAISAESVRESIGINREIADRQKLITELQSRAYVVVGFDLMIPQNANAGIRYEPGMLIENRGSTPAHEVRFSIFADVLPSPMRDDFAFPLPVDDKGRSSVIGPSLSKIVSAVVPKSYPQIETAQIESGIGQRIVTWGIVRYKDAFEIERFTKFGFTFHRLGENVWMSQDTTKNNESN